MPAPVLQFKRGNAGVAGTVPALRQGEPAISLNNFDFFIGIDSSVVNNKFFGSHRYWGREDGTNSLTLKLVDRNGTNYVAIKSPNTLGGNVTYTLPGTQGASSSVLTNDGSGNLTWGSGSSNAVFSGITTFSDTTNNTLGNENTGSIQIVGGVGIAKNLTVKENLYVGGYSEFVGVVTFKGGTINLGDGNTDNINVSGEFISNLVPNTDNTYDIGITTQKWRDAHFSGIGSFAAGTIANAVRIGYSASGVIDTTSGDLTLSPASGIVIVNNNLKVGGNVIQASTGTTAITLSSADVIIAGDLQISGNDIKSSTGATAITLAANDVTIADDLTIQGNLYVNGSTTQVNTTAITVEDRTIELGVVDGTNPSTSTTWDLGVLFNYNASGAKKSAVIWEHSTTRFQFASVLDADTNGTDVNTPQLTANTFAPIEIGSLWVTDCAGTSQVISCTGTERFLENITIDAGVF